MLAFSGKGEKKELDHGSRFFSLSTPGLEDKAEELRRLREEAKIALHNANRQYDQTDRVMELKDRISRITRRNKRRTILVIPFIEEDNPLVDILLRSNSNARATFAKSVSDGVERLRSQEFDMVYLVLDFAKEGHGCCFMSGDSSEDEELRRKNPEITEIINGMRDHARGAELVAVCGTSQADCPLANNLAEYKARKEAV